MMDANNYIERLIMKNNETQKVFYWTSGVIVGTILTSIAIHIGVSFAVGCVIGYILFVLLNK